MNKALVVDDDHYTSNYLSIIVCDAGFRAVEQASDGQEALSSLQNNLDTELVICDLCMPNMDGLEFLRNLAKLETAPPVVLMSGYDSWILETAQQLGEELGLSIAATISKPFEIESINDAVEKARSLGGKRPVVRQPEIHAQELLDAIWDEKINVAFQPQISISSSKLAGFESLARWNSQKHGDLSPRFFVDYAERNQIIHELTWATIHSTLELARITSPMVEPDCTFSINLSSVILGDLTFPDHFSEVLKQYDIAPNRIVIEVTESSFMYRRAACLEVMARMSLRGFKFSLDDFGTGYSSLDRLRLLTFRELKVDRSFVGSAAHEPRTHAILETSVNLANKLGMNIIAEGIEDADELHAMKELNFDIAQGYYFGKPMHEEKLVEWIESYNS